MSAPAREIWALTGPRQGDAAQLRALLADLGEPSREIALAHGPLREAPNAWLGASLISLRQRPEDLRPPWPAAVIAAGRRAVPAARWIAAQSGGRARLIHLGRPRAPLRHFDLVLTTPQYGLPEAANLRRLSLPWQAPLSTPPAAAADHVVALLGGDSWSVRLGGETADALADLARARARALGLPAVAATGPRTPPGLADRLRRRLGPGAQVYDWTARGGRDNPYPAWLAAAAEVVVTGDSVSALADAAWTGRPVVVVPAPERPWLRALTRLGGAPARRWRRAGGNLGLAAPPPQPGAVLTALQAQGLAREQDDGSLRLPPLRERLEAERAEILRRIRALLASPA